MKAAKRIAIALVVYIGLVIAFESLLGFFQPAGQGTLVITTTAADGTQDGRVVARLESDDQLYVAATAVPVTGAEHDRVDADHALGVVFRILTGFPPRYFVRLDPR